MSKKNEKIELLDERKLRELYKDFTDLPFHIAETGKNKGHEVLDVAFRQWRKGTQRNTIFNWFTRHNITEWDVKNASR